MKFGRVRFGNREVFGYIDENDIVEVSRDEQGNQVEKGRYSLADGRILVPVIPTKIIAIGLNYKAHAAEMGKPLPEEPLMFLKPATAVVAHDESIVLPLQSEQVEFEGELAVIIGRQCRQVTEAEALDYVLGYTCLNDVTARDLQRKDVQYTRAKGFDTFAPIGPFFANDLDPSRLSIRTWLNGELRQDSTTADMIFSVPQIIAHVSSVMTLRPGDIISTGTPAGVGPMRSGDIVEIEIEGIGRLRNQVIAQA